MTETVTLVPAEYTDLAQVRTFNQDEDMLEDLVMFLIPAVSRAIDRLCRRVFFTTQAMRIYDWQDNHTVRLRDDLVALTTILTNTGQTFTANDFVLTPYEGPPYARLVAREGLGSSLVYQATRTAALQVNGLWGYQMTLPPEVGLACTAWVSDIYAQSDTRGLESMSGGGVRAAMRKLEEGPPPDVKGWLTPFFKPTRLAVLSSTGRVFG